MIETLTMIILYVGGERHVTYEVPAPLCLATQREWRYADAIGKPFVALDMETRVKRRVSEIQCEVNPSPARQQSPTS